MHVVSEFELCVCARVCVHDSVLCTCKSMKQKQDDLVLPTLKHDSQNVNHLIILILVQLIGTQN